MNPHAHPPRIEELLAHAGWVQGLALRLVKDPGTADDLVQEAWLAAVRNPPEPSVPARGWLAGVVRNLARQRFRGESRRRAREAQVAETRQGPPSTEALAAKMETQRDLAEAILELTEPSKSTVILRFLEGLSSAEIARREGVPAATVRGRLKRGVDELRLILDRRSGGDRRKWIGALVPFLRPPAAPVVGASVVGSMVSGVLAMSLTTKIISSTVLVAVLYFGLVQTGILELGPDSDPGVAEAADGEGLDVGSGGVPSLAARGTDTPSGDPGDAMPGGANAVGGKDPADETTLAAFGWIQARILDADGRPLEGATFRAMSASLTATSNHLGKLRLVVPTAKCGGHLRFLVYAKGMAHRVVEAYPEVGLNVRLGDVSLRPGGGVRGRVVDERGVLIPLAEVSAGPPDMSPRALSRAAVHGPVKQMITVAPAVAFDGTFAVTGLPTGYVRLWATSKDRRHGWSDPVEVRAGETTGPVILRLDPLLPEDAIRGRVRYPDGRPAEGATVRFDVRALEQNTNSGVLSKPDGTFEIRMSPDAVATLRFRTADGWTAPSLKDVKGSAQVLDIVLEKSQQVHVKVTTADGVAMQTATVYVLDPKAIRMISYFADGYPADGVVAVNIPAEAYIIKVAHGGYRAQIFGPYASGEQPGQLEAVLERLPTLKGRVLAGGKPVAMATVLLHRPTRLTDHTVHNGFQVLVEPSPTAQTRTDADGRFALGVSEGGTFVLRAQAPGYAPTEIKALRVDGERGQDGIELTLSAGGHIAGTVRPKAGAGAAGLIVGISRADGYAVTVRTDAKGGYRFSHLMPGKWVVRIVDAEVHASGSSTHQTRDVKPPTIRWNATVQEGETTQHDIDLDAEGAKDAQIHAKITINGVAPVGWTWMLYDELSDVGMPVQLARGAVSPDGVLKTQRKGDGNAILMITSAGQRTGRRGLFVPIELVAGRNDFDLSSETGTLIGTVKPGTLVPGDRLFHITLKGGGAVGLTQIAPAEDGTFRIEGAFAGPGRIVRLDPKTLRSMPPSQALNPGSWPAIKDVVVKPGVETTVQVP